MSIRIITDSASDYPKAAENNVTVLPMTISFGFNTYLDGVTLSHHEFYEKLIESDVLPVTSLVSPGDFEEAFRESVEAGDSVICITVSSKLSGTWQSAVLGASEYAGKVFVVDSLNASIGETILVDRALELVKAGLGVEEIVEKLDEEKKDIRVIAMLNTLEYLQKGGRLSASAALIGGVLGIKPVIAIEDGEVKVLGKARGSKSGNNLLITEIGKTNGIDFTRPYHLGYTGLHGGMLNKYINDSTILWEGHTDHLPVCSIGGTIGTHVGPDAIAVAFFRQH
ncbi:MAG: DegV family protein [Erysipelotrichaceae bacterium]|nr:DegV family protein [Erysipelotrichaceae bacterium]